MSKRVQTIEIEGFGPVTIQGLTESQMQRLLQRKPNSVRFTASLLKRGLVSPK